MHQAQPGERYGTGDKEVGQDGYDRFDASPAGAVHKESGNDCKKARVKGRLAQRSCFGDAHADLLHQSRREGTERGETKEPGKSQGTTFSASEEGSRPGEKKQAGIGEGPCRKKQRPRKPSRICAKGSRRRPRRENSFMRKSSTCAKASTARAHRSRPLPSA